ncbi:type VI secretion system ATPase TssH [Pokkaliibacter plantistimulans]|uniref:Type VI secretion system ATPase TssH n=1 Tax=Proteobacteria bacterium 228 TaxID=2083153 RepID=A0A2S5KN87_9PROT|nr:type VI secretion system ATPase TssH [Pokkaliibacter plantistimulans]PPC76258.1 type VI secretion system ATPase TssH [Pokkaliibacter plantistimulans]
MSSMTLKHLVEKLNPTCRSALEAAAALCQSRSHFSVEVQHWLTPLAANEHSDLHLLLRCFEVQPEDFHGELQRALEALRTGNDAVPGLSAQLVHLLQESWVACSIAFQDDSIRSAHLLYALVKDEGLALLWQRYMPSLARLDAAQLLNAWPQLRHESGEHQGGAAAPAAARAEGDSSKISRTPALDQFTQDLTAQAREGKLDPILGRDDEIRQMIDILTRRRQNNPILTGEAGVGKTAVVEGLAQRIAAGDVPEVLKAVSVRVLDLALLQAGAGMKGEFENRLKGVISEVRASATPIILFIDEAHTLIGSGGQAGQNDAANLLKPALARGELRTIAATTWAEYKKYFEKDAALTRRFQVVKVEEPSAEQAIIMLRGLLPVMQRHHGVSIADAALKAAVHLSQRYINGRQLPDKAVALLDTACARVAMSQAAVPARVEQLQRQAEALSAEISQLRAEQLATGEHTSVLTALQERQQEVEAALQREQAVWQAEKLAVQQADSHYRKLADDTLNEGDREQQRQAFRQFLQHYADNGQPMVHWQVDEQLVAAVVSDWTGIPLGRMQADEISAILGLEQRLAERVIGQPHALRLISQTVQTARAQLADENRPNGIFLLTGPSGVGKTETALALAEQVFGSEDKVTVINMSEFKEEHKVSLLLGSPPGYVGYGEGGVLTEAVRRKPYSVILLDEMEKAHPGVQDIFYQVFDKGTIKDGEGRDIDFRNTIIIMTCNVGSDTTLQLFEDPETAPGVEGLRKALQEDLLKVFKPAFLGRLNVVPYVPLSSEMLTAIAQLQLQRIERRLRQHHQTALVYGEEVLSYIVQGCQDAGSGARTIHNTLHNQLLPLLSVAILNAVAERRALAQIKVNCGNDGFVLDIASDVADAM